MSTDTDGLDGWDRFANMTGENLAKLFVSVVGLAAKTHPQLLEDAFRMAFPSVGRMVEEQERVARLVAVVVADFQSVRDGLQHFEDELKERFESLRELQAQQAKLAKETKDTRTTVVRIRQWLIQHVRPLVRTNTRPSPTQPARQATGSSSNSSTSKPKTNAATT